MAFADNKPSSTDPVIGANDPFFSNTWDATQQALQTALEVGHTAAGVHDDTGITGTNYGLIFTKRGTYTGNASTDQVITVSDMAEVLYVKIWEESSAVPIVATTTMNTGDAKRLTYEAFSTDYIKSLGTGQFTATGSGNTDSTSYFYLAIGKKATSPSDNGSSFTPSWIDHNDLIDVSGVTKIPNDLVDELITKFKVEHTDPAGAHTSAAYQDIGKIVVGSFAADGTASQQISLPNSSWTIKKLVFLTDNNRMPFLQTNSMSTIRLMNNFVVTNTGFLTLNTGNFVVDGTKYIDSQQILYYPSNTFDGDSSFSDSSPIGSLRTITKEGTPLHKTAQYYTAASSIYIVDRYPSTSDAVVASFLTDFDKLPADFSVYLAIKTSDSTAKPMFAIGGAPAKFRISTTPTNAYVSVYGAGSITGTTTINDNAWHTIEAKRVSGTVSLLVDGGSEGTPISSTGEINPALAMRLGCEASGSIRPVTGYYDEIKVEAQLSGFKSGDTYHYIAFCE